jgi:hypothetical protein
LPCLGFFPWPRSPPPPIPSPRSFTRASDLSSPIAVWRLPMQLLARPTHPSLSLPRLLMMRRKNLGLSSPSDGGWRRGRFEHVLVHQYDISSVICLA